LAELVSGRIGVCRIGVSLHAARMAAPEPMKMGIHSG
jgi:hypothetical protein